MSTDTNESIDKLVEELSKMSVLDMAKLKKALEEKWGVKAAAAVAAAPVAAADAGAAKEEATDFKVTLEEVPADKKISVIKAVREITGLGLKEAKDLATDVPKVLKESVPKAEAEEIQKKIDAAGGKVSLKGL